MNLKESKERLSAALGDDMKTYLEYLKLWFRQKVTREEFESRTRRLLKQQHLLRLHNEFILDLLAECQNFSVTKPLVPYAASSATALSTYSTTHKRRKMDPGVAFQAFQSPTETLLHVDFEKSKATTDIPSVDAFPSYCSNDLLLPDISLVAGRARITSWLYDLPDGVSDEACQLIVQACSNIMKRIVNGSVNANTEKVYRRCGGSGPMVAPLGRSVALQPNSPWPDRLFDAIYPELNPKNYALENNRSLLSSTTYRELVESQEAYLLSFEGAEAKRPGIADVLTMEHIKKAFELSYLDLCLPSSFHSRCLIRINGAMSSAS